MPSPPLHPEIYRLRPWYHDFSALGLQTVFPVERPALRDRLRNVGRALLGRPRRPHLLCRSHHYLVNQRCKEPVLTAMIRRALDAIGAGDGTPRGLDLFCADGYYSCLLRRLCPQAAVVGVDRDGEDLERARAAAAALELEGVRFVQADVAEYLAAGERFDLVLCAGGLYHLSQPGELVARVARAARGFAIFQSVVTLDSEDSGYFVAPAPGWRHGSRFSHARLRRWIVDSGLEILGEERNVLEGNRRSQDRGSSYFLCRPCSSS